MKYYYTRKEVSEWLKENKILNHEEIDKVLLKVKKGRWTPREYDNYYYINTWGNTSQTNNIKHYIDEWNIKIGNCFRTEKEAEVYKQKLIDLGKTS